MVSTYSEAGVDIDASERATEALIAQIKGVNRKGDGEAIKLDNGFAGLVKLGDGALAMCTDGVGSKILLAEEMDSIHTVGICLLYTSPSPRDQRGSRMPSSA